jgi:hypothetical protein
MRTPLRLLHVVAFVLGMVLVAAGVSINWRLAQSGGQDFIPPYLLGAGLLHGIHVYTVPDLASALRNVAGSGFVVKYVPPVMLYSPSSGIPLIPLALLPLDVAQQLFFVLSCTALLAGAYVLASVVHPGLAPGYGVLVVGALACTSVLRWAFAYLQVAPLIFGLLCLFSAALCLKRNFAALVLGAVALCLKFTFGLPFFGLAVLQRRYVLAASIVAVWILANAIGFARMGGLEAVAGYQSYATQFGQLGTVDSPDFRDGYSMMRLDWTYLVFAIVPDVSRANVVSGILTGACVLWLLWQGYRSRRFSTEIGTAVAFLGPLVCLSLLSVYHHHYDAVVLFAPAIAYIVQYVRDRRTLDARLVGLYLISVILFAGIYGYEQGPVLLDRIFHLGAYAYMLKLLGTVSITVALIASLLFLNIFVRRREATALGEPQAVLAQRAHPVLA